MTLVLGYDESHGAQRAVEVCLDLAGALGEPVVVVSGVDPPGNIGDELEEHRAAIAETTERGVQSVVDRAAVRGVEVSVELPALKPAAALVDAADRHDARMIVVGSYGEGALRGALLGSTSYRVLAAATCPVLVVRAHEGD